VSHLAGICSSGRRPDPGHVQQGDRKGRALIIEVVAGEYNRQDSPAFFQLPESWRDQRDFILERIDTGEVVDTQTEVGV
jgi:hypothetical protein